MGEFKCQCERRKSYLRFAFWCVFCLLLIAISLSIFILQAFGSTVRVVMIAIDVVLVIVSVVLLCLSNSKKETTYHLQDYINTHPDCMGAKIIHSFITQDVNAFFADNHIELEESYCLIDDYQKMEAIFKIIHGDKQFVSVLEKEELYYFFGDKNENIHSEDWIKVKYKDISNETNTKVIYAHLVMLYSRLIKTQPSLTK